MPTTTLTFATASDALCFTSGNGWTNPSDALVLDGTGTTASCGPASSTRALGVYGPSDAPPAGATIDSITVVITARQTAGVPLDTAAYIAKNATDCGTWVNLGAHPDTPGWSDEWSTKFWDVDTTGWVASDFGANFGAGYSFHHASAFALDSVEVDEIKVQVTYTVPVLCAPRRVSQPGCCDCDNLCETPSCTIHERWFQRSATTDLGPSFDEVSGDFTISSGHLNCPDGGELQCTRVPSPATNMVRNSLRIFGMDDGATVTATIADGDMQAMCTRDGDTYSVALIVDGSTIDTVEGSTEAREVVVCSNGSIVTAALGVDTAQDPSPFVQGSVSASTGTHAGLLSTGTGVRIDRFNFTRTDGHCPGCPGLCAECGNSFYPGNVQAELTGTTTSPVDCSACQTVYIGTFILPVDGDDGCSSRLDDWDDALDACFPKPTDVTEITRAIIQFTVEASPMGDDFRRLRLWASYEYRSISDPEILHLAVIGSWVVDLPAPLDCLNIPRTELIYDDYLNTSPRLCEMADVRVWVRAL